MSIREERGGWGGAERHRHNGTLEDEWEREGRRKGGVRAAVIDKTDWRSSLTPNQNKRQLLGYADTSTFKLHPQTRFNDKIYGGGRTAGRRREQAPSAAIQPTTVNTHL